MEIINIEKKTFEAMMMRLECYARKAESIFCRYGRKPLKKVYDSQDVCLILNISIRTLQTLRENGTLPFARKGRKIWYDPQVVEQLLGKVHEPLKTAH